MRTGTAKMLLCGQRDSFWSVYLWKTRTFWTRSAHHLRSSWKWARALGQPPHPTIRTDSPLIHPYVTSAAKKWLNFCIVCLDALRCRLVSLGVASARMSAELQGGGEIVATDGSKTALKHVRKNAAENGMLGKVGPLLTLLFVCV
jgi:hypothetical protein